MNLTILGPNKTEIKMTGGLTVLFSYNTPVACRWSNGHDSYSIFKTEKFWSPTTSRHINSWIEETQPDEVMIKPQEYFDNLVSEVA